MTRTRHSATVAADDAWLKMLHGLARMSRGKVGFFLLPPSEPQDAPDWAASFRAQPASGFFPLGTMELLCCRISPEAPGLFEKLASLERQVLAGEAYVLHREDGGCVGGVVRFQPEETRDEAGAVAFRAWCSSALQSHFEALFLDAAGRLKEPLRPTLAYGLLCGGDGETLFICATQPVARVPHGADAPCSWAEAMVVVPGLLSWAEARRENPSRSIVDHLADEIRGYGIWAARPPGLPRNTLRALDQCAYKALYNWLAKPDPCTGGRRVLPAGLYVPTRSAAIDEMIDALPLGREGLRRLGHALERRGQRRA